MTNIFLSVLPDYLFLKLIISYLYFSLSLHYIDDLKIFFVFKRVSFIGQKFITSKTAECKTFTIKFVDLVTSLNWHSEWYQ